VKQSLKKIIKNIFKKNNFFLWPRILKITWALFLNSKILWHVFFLRCCMDFTTSLWNSKGFDLHFKNIKNLLFETNWKPKRGGGPFFLNQVKMHNVLLYRKKPWNQTQMRQRLTKKEFWAVKSRRGKLTLQLEKGTSIEIKLF
jgi:hypothetical protein